MDALFRVLFMALWATIVISQLPPQDFLPPPPVYDTPTQEVVSEAVPVYIKDTAGNVLLTGQHIARAVPTWEWDSIVVKLEFTPEGTLLFADATRNNIGRHLLIWVDGQLVSSPIVNSTVTDGIAIISGGFTKDTAATLSRQLTQSF